MAQLRLTIGDIAVTNEHVTSTVTIDKQTYNVSLIGLSFQKKMYQPTEVLAELEFDMSEAATPSDWKAISRENIENLFKNKKAVLDEVTINEESNEKGKLLSLDIIGNDFYVYDVHPHYQPDCMFVNLTIYSLDKLLTLNKECNSYVGKTLSGIIDSVLANYKIPYETKNSLSHDESGMQVLQIDASGSDSDATTQKKEHKFPYLIQYNESFYDLLKRTTNRWGEFLYWENGTLTIGYDNSDPITLDQSKYTDIYYFDLDNGALKIPDAGSYDYAATYDENVGNKPIKKDPYEVYGKLGRFNGQFDKYAFSVASRFFQNEESLTAWAVGLLVDDLWDLLAESTYVFSDNRDFKNEYFNGKCEDDQYDSDNSKLNLYTEYDSKYDKNSSYYSEILGYETAAGKNAIRIKYDTTWPKLKLGDVIKVNDEQFIVVEVLAKAPKDLKIVNNSKVIICPGNTITFEVVATANNSGDKKFYPATLPTGHVRRSGPQVATIVDMDDPLKANRVRVVYDWQGDNAADNESAYSPWLLYAAGSHGSPRGGRHLNGTKVLVGFASDNIERPYVLGNIQEADTFVELKDVSLETPGKRKFQMWDHVGGVQKFLSGTIAPIVSTVSDFCPAVDYFSAGDGGLQYAGGFCITDRLGLYNISGSTDEREVKISSAWGDVKISAFTGISISAPNGDVKINGKNVEISAGNNLTLTSGKNVGYHLAWGKGEDPSVSSVLSDVCCKLIEKIGEKVQLIDLSFLRNTLEVVFRPHEGSLTLKSNRYMKLETGTNECDYPVAAYNKDYRQYIVDEEAKSTILSSVGGSSLIPGSVVPTFSIIRSLIWIIEKLPGIARVWLVSYKRNYDNLVELRKRFDKTIDTLKTYSDDQEDVCNKYDDMKDDFWDTSDEDDWTEEKLGFKENVKVEGQALEIVEEVCRNRNRTSVPINLQGQPEKIASWVVDRRTKCRNLLVKIANDMRKAIRELRPEWSKEDLSKQFSNEVGYFRPFPDDFITNLENALSKDNCGDVAVFKTDTEMKSLKNIYMLTKLEEKYMTRFVAVKFLQSLGFKDDMRRKLKKVGGEIEISEPDFSSKSASDSTSIVNDGYWNDYVQSLSGVPAIKKAESSFLSSVADSAMDAVLGAVSVDEILKFKENYSWSEGKKGGVLFGYKGDTYELKGKEIEKIETIEPSFKSISENSEGIDECDKVKLVNFMNKLRSVMGNLK